MPQIAQIAEIYASQLFWLAITFTLVLVTVGYGMLPKIQSTIDARDGRIAADLGVAEEARAKADALEDGYRQEMDRARSEAAKVAAEAKAAAAKSTEAAVAKADKAIAAKIDKAMVGIGAARTDALAHLETVAAEAAGDIVERVSGMTVDPARVRAMVARELTHV